MVPHPQQKRVPLNYLRDQNNPQSTSLLLSGGMWPCPWSVLLQFQALESLCPLRAPWVVGGPPQASQAPERAGHISGGRYPYQTEVPEPSGNQSALGHSEL